MSLVEQTNFEWVIFDAVGTLMTPAPPVARAYWEAGHRFGSRLDEAEVRRRFNQAFRETERNDVSATEAGSPASLQTSEEAERRRWRTIVGRVFDDIAEPDACFEELFAHFAQPSSWRWYDDVAPAIRQLRSAGLRVGVASNFDSRLDGLLDSSGFVHHFALRAVSSRIGFRKPSGQFFQAVCDMAGTPAERIVFVGDDPTNDIAGAKSAGLAAVRIARHDDVVPGPDRVNDLRQILPMLASQ